MSATPRAQAPISNDSCAGGGASLLYTNKHHHHIDPHTHTHLTSLFPGLPGSAGTRKVKPIWILLKQEAVSGSGISWAICKSAPRSRQITTPAPHRMPFLPPNQQRQSAEGTQEDTHTGSRIHAVEAELHFFIHTHKTTLLLCDMLQVCMNPASVRLVCHRCL